MKYLDLVTIGVKYGNLKAVTTSLQGVINCIIQRLFNNLFLSKVCIPVQLLEQTAQ